MKIIFFILLFSTCTICFAETNYKSLTPGKSTRSEVDQVLGQPVKEYSATLVEYRPDLPVQTKIYVQYRKDSSVIERIEILLKQPSKRETIINLLHLPIQATKTHINTHGNLEEYFGSPFYFVLTYQGDTNTNGAIRTGRYSRELFNNAISNFSVTPMSSESVSLTNNSCFKAMPAFAIASRQAYFDWAKQQNSPVLDEQLKAKLAMLFHCNTIDNDKLAVVFTDISLIIAKYVPDAKCFDGDMGVVQTNADTHYKWASARTREQMLENLTWKVIAGMHCLNRNSQNDFFAEISEIVAKAGQVK